MQDTATILSILGVIALGTGGGGILGAIIMFRRFRLEASEAATKERVSLAQVDVQQFEALFPDGPWDAIKHWKEEATDLYAVTAALRKELDTTKTELRETKAELRQTRAELVVAQTDLATAKERITHLEQEAGHGR
jgi:peptidoglycan hydrolase CwlO-like protein